MMTNTSFIFRVICIVSLLLGCSPSNSELAGWQIKQGNLWFGSETVLWQEATTIENCNACNIKKIADFHPSGPSSTYLLFEGEKWRASNVDEFRNWIIIWHNKRPVKLFVNALSEQKLLLSLPSGDIKLSLGSRVNFSFEGKHYQLWLKSYRQPLTSEQYENELDSHHINYILLSVD